MNKTVVTGLSVGIELPVDMVSGQTPLMMLFEGGGLSMIAMAVVNNQIKHNL